MAQMAREEKGAISHRGRAIRRLVAMLRQTIPADTKQP
jgi:inosine/xanthosine triphosphate pyrophosphatase family protein